VRLAWEDEHVRLTVQDDGNGFDLAAAEGKGLGLASMRERVAALEGTLTISTLPEGTRIEACVPSALDSLREAAEVAHD